MKKFRTRNLGELFARCDAWLDRGFNRITARFANTPRNESAEEGGATAAIEEVSEKASEEALESFIFLTPETPPEPVIPDEFDYRVFEEDEKRRAEEYEKNPLADPLLRFFLSQPQFWEPINAKFVRTRDSFFAFVEGIEPPNTYLKTPHTACRQGDMSALEDYLEHHFTSPDNGCFETHEPMLCLRKSIEMNTILAELNTPDNHGFTPLHYACILRHSEIVAFLLRLGVDTSRRHKNFHLTPLETAIQYGFGEIVTLFLSHDKEHGTTHASHRDPFGVTPLMYAVIQEQRNIVRLFCAFDQQTRDTTTKAIPSIQIPQGSTALHIAIRLRSLPMIRILTDKRNSYDIAPMMRDGEHMDCMALARMFMPKVAGLVEALIKEATPAPNREIILYEYQLIHRMRTHERQISA